MDKWADDTRITTCGWPNRSGFREQEQEQVGLDLEIFQKLSPVRRHTERTWRCAVCMSSILFFERNFIKHDFRGVARAEMCWHGDAVRAGIAR